MSDIETRARSTIGNVFTKLDGSQWVDYDHAISAMVQFAKNEISEKASLARPQGGGEDALVRDLRQRIDGVIEFQGYGCWQTCTGCHETEDGYDVGHYPHSVLLGCKLGGGCSECGGIGAVWDNTDWEDFARWSMEQDGTALRTPPADEDTITVEDADRSDWPQKSAEEISDIIQTAYLAGATEKLAPPYNSVSEMAYDYMISIGPMVPGTPPADDRGDALREAVREAIALIDEINERKASRDFNGINGALHAKLCTIRITLARAALATREGE